MPSAVILVAHSGLRQVSEEEIVPLLNPTLLPLPRQVVAVDTRPFAAAVERGDWGEQDTYIRNVAAEIHRVADQLSDPQLHFFGIAEVPHVLALGAYVGDERKVVLHDFRSTAGNWAWPVLEKTLNVEAVNVPTMPPVSQRGAAVIRVAISAAITDEQVRPWAGDELLADITIRPIGGLAPETGAVRSDADVEHIRSVLHSAYAALLAARPQVELIHLFVAAPVSVCFAVGQELDPRNSPPIQTYRFRREQGYTAAIRIAATQPASSSGSVSDADRKVADRIRKKIWPQALEDVVLFAGFLGKHQKSGEAWFAHLEPRAALALVAPFPHLRPVSEIAPTNDGVDDAPFNGEYGYDKDEHKWRLSDALLLGFWRAAGANADRLRQLIRLFLWHEYLHDYHSLSKYTAAQVGKFANCLEHVDFTADTYALLHQLGWTHVHDARKVDSDQKTISFLADQVELVIRSFWAFDPPPPIDEWQVRRLRRYLNWYWRHIQLQRAPDVETALRLFCKQPHIEISGIDQIASGRYVRARLTQLDPGTDLELGIVLDDERLFRVSEGANTSLKGLIQAFRQCDHEQILGFFRSVFELARQTGGELPKLPPRGSRVAGRRK